MKNIHLPIMEIVNPDGGKIEVPAFAVPSEAIDDSTITDQSAWSSKKTSDEIRKAKKEAIDSCAPLFHKKASIVQGELVKDYPLSVKTHIVPLQEGTGDPSPENVRPIHGWNDLRLEHCGKNLYDNESARKAESWSKEVYSYIPFKVGKGNKVTVSYSKKLDSGLGIFVTIGQIAGLSSKSYGWLYHSNTPSVCNNQLTIIAESDYIYLNSASMDLEDKRNVFCDNIGDSLQIEISSDKTYYEPYHGESFFQKLPEEISGGVYDWENGELKILYNKINLLSSSRLFVYDKGSTVIVDFDNIATPTSRQDIGSGKFTHFKTLYNNNDVEHAYQNGTNARLYISKSRLDTPDKAGVIAWLKAQETSGHTVQCVYELTEPVIMQLTPQQIIALDGVTTLYSNTGDTEVTGRADSSAIIAQMQSDIAALQNAVVKS